MSDDDLKEWLGVDKPPTNKALAFADRALARATIQPARTSIEAARLAVAYEYDIAAQAEFELGYDQARAEWGKEQIR